MNTKGEDFVKEVVAIDVGSVRVLEELHSLLKRELGFPNYYGMNWDSFWDAITGLVEMPDTLVFIGWKNLKEQLPEDSQIMVSLLEKYNEQFSSWKCNVLFK
ncbi:barnase inhibitor [Bacillus sp. AFS018417]|uniref:barstar family protein n=1 Tax=Bacillus sp. AFS018417 TaxID=2033491 RepID=UPI000BF4186D|nr:barstar family protein [Bacillus sp. AFS018417]PEZ03304.1 barnase inhibitor [Bacillus sp. AFS018417]